MAPTAQPTAGELALAGGPLWRRLCEELGERYWIQPKIEYSGCSMAPGWNVKYRKGSGVRHMAHQVSPREIRLAVFVHAGLVKFYFGAHLGCGDGTEGEVTLCAHTAAS